VLDANVWRRIVDARAGDQLIRAAVRANAEILAAPTIAYEALRTPQNDVREKLLSEITKPRWVRLMPEVFSESRELLGEIHRLRPVAIKPKADVAAFSQLRASWTNPKRGFWARVKDAPSEELRLLDVAGQKRLLEAGREQARARREEMKSAPEWEHVPLDQLGWIPAGDFKGWSGKLVEPWRVDAFATFDRALPDPTSAYRDWLEPFCDINRLLEDRTAWTNFWFEEVAVERLPRMWVRWAVEYLQRFRKVTPGTPGDSQLATHLCEADALITEDRTLVQIIENAKRYAPIPMGRGVIVEGNSVHAILKAVSESSAHQGAGSAN
jgi:hypothetical protein